MARALRYTGCWPPPDVLKTYPNWVFASDEECEPDQDETTIKPEAQQSFLSDETDCTAAMAMLADGTTTDAILSFINGKIEAIHVWNGQDWWSLRGEFNQTNWTPVVETWLPEGNRRPTVTLSDARLFPARIVSTLPYCEGPRCEIVIPLVREAETAQQKPWH